MDKRRRNQNGTEFSNSIQQREKENKIPIQWKETKLIQFTKEETKKGYKKVQEGYF